MTEDAIISRAKTAFAQRNIAICSAIFLGITTLLLAVSLFRLDSRTILVPSMGGPTMEVSGNGVSASYLEALSRDITTTFLNTTPQSEKYVSRVLLSLSCPEYHGSLDQQITDRWKDVKRFQLNTVFYPQSITIQDNALSTRIRGRLDSYVGDTRTSTKQKFFELAFRNRTGRICLSSFVEIDRSGSRVENEQPEKK